MKVTLIAATRVDHAAMTQVMDTDLFFGNDIDTLHEFAGRACYQSFDKPNPATRENKDYLGNIIEQGHFSVMEHGSATFYVEGISRALTHELIRHRHLSYSQLSQRFVDESNGGYVYPPAFGDTEKAALDLVMEGSQGVYTALVNRLVAGGATRKEAREAARAVLPNAVETKIVVTGNIRAWREVIAKRDSPHADAEIRLFAQEIAKHLAHVAPNSVSDLKDN